MVYSASLLIRLIRFGGGGQVNPHYLVDNVHDTLVTTKGLHVYTFYNYKQNAVESYTYSSLS